MTPPVNRTTHTALLNSADQAGHSVLRKAGSSVSRRW